jgi:hypothetical protein
MVASARREGQGSWWATALVLVVLAIAGGARADGRSDFLASRLRYPPSAGLPDDFRVRLTAAQALGATNDDGAVQPLCDSLLGDPNEVVRQAVAVALKRLGKPASLPCLRSRLASEKSDRVRLQVSRALESIDATASNSDSSVDTPRNVPGAKYYVSLSPVSHQTARSQNEIDRVVLSAVKSKLESAGSCQLAPHNESVDVARGTMQKRKLKGFYLSLAVDKFDYSGGNLKVTVRVVIFTYPGKAMQAMLNKSVTQQGVRPNDKSAEDNLLAMAAQAAVDQFAQNAASF